MADDEYNRDGLRTFPRELAYDREVRERQRGCAPVLIVLLMLVAIGAVAYWLWPR